jgi:hypothetical protein
MFESSIVPFFAKVLIDPQDMPFVMPRVCPIDARSEERIDVDFIVLFGGS